MFKSKFIILFTTIFLFIKRWLRPNTEKKPVHWGKSIWKFQMLIFRWWIIRVQVFRKIPCTHFLQHAWNKSCPQTGDRQTDRQQTDGQTDRRIMWKQYTLPPNFVCGGTCIKIKQNIKKCKIQFLIRKRSKSVSTIKMCR